ncbi:MAG TPA: folylpolyglutamate synthase/dihydrofolate synthase family protein [Ignavibacteria bacterium]|nr:folylpolyglutamate synthase/dihydrofolate synthase family protein [Ignavibacteria bacterium]
MDDSSSYKKVINYLFSLERLGIKYNLNNINYLLEHLGNPQKNFKSIHIAGTNGKGSVSSYLNSILIESGYKTALYTSPHILDFRERISVNGNLITKNFIITFTENIKSVIKKINPSFFEVTTAMAFEYFSVKKADVAVIETGLGGRLDSTNVLNPLVSVITAIGIDHTSFLGNSIEKITFEKAGIIKKKSFCVTGKLPKISYKIIEEKCEKLKTHYINSDKEKLFEKFVTDVKISPDYQKINLNTVMSVITVLNFYYRFNIKKSDIKSGIKNVSVNSHFHGRFEKIHSNPIVITDVSHNPQALSNLKSNLKNYKHNKLIVIFGLMADKDINKCAKEIEKLNSEKIILTKAEIKRSLGSDELKEYFKNKKKLILSENLSEALKIAKSIITKKDLLLVTGSFYVVSDFLLANKKLKLFN